MNFFLIGIINKYHHRTASGENIKQMLTDTSNAVADVTVVTSASVTSWRVLTRRVWAASRHAAGAFVNI